ncbi:MgtC/SapB family protein [Draconibacterium halophilum]|uniref:MgtC/SapB family protein n=1 Tax=Draconibacterium halophilum TaxID=2706887 RepID=A0A6C0RGB7_9BACT|nr:MgtC/SapB family protein [Draconibacterium halophilum]QIA09758.1 MgtC/SapB family protein [Draconibacterium halophilum]
METYYSQLWILLDLIIAAVLCSVIGGEREKLDKPAGLRTNIIVGSIACFFVSISPGLSNFLIENMEPDHLSMDAIRILQAIVVGVSFIGAGTILKSKDENNVRNLTTASTLLYSAGIGISVALHVYIIAIGLALMGLIINSLNKIWAFFYRIFKK